MKILFGGKNGTNVKRTDLTGVEEFTVSVPSDVESGKVTKVQFIRADGIASNELDFYISDVSKIADTTPEDTTPNVRP